MNPIFTIGFTRSTARHFFGRLRDAGVTEVVDVRLHNTSQLAGFAKSDDLRFFLETMGIGYRHEPALAPTEALLGAYRSRRMRWDDYASSFRRLLEERGIAKAFPAASLAGRCLLCSEDTPEHCHRRLIAEYVAAAAAKPPAIRHL